MTENKQQMFTFSTKLDPANFNWSEKELEAVKIYDIQGISEIIKKRITSIKSVELEALYVILHDRDVMEKYDETKDELVCVEKDAHIHVLGRFKSKKEGATIAKLASVLGLAENIIEKPKQGRFAYDNMLAYLVHAKERDKVHYDPTQVITVVGKPYIEVYKENIETWNKGKAKKNKSQAIEDIDYVLEQIIKGDLLEDDMLSDDAYDALFINYANKIDSAFDLYARKQAQKTIKALENGEFRITPVFITGKAGKGKTRFANLVIERIKEWSKHKYGNSWRCCTTAATNPMDEYRGEEILLMDDLRGASLTASDWLKLLDNYNTSPASARYSNKKMACRVILITSTKEPLEFFSYCKAIGGGDRAEALDQFLRRLQMGVYLLDSDDFTMSSEESHLKLVNFLEQEKPYTGYIPDNTTEPEQLRKDLAMYDIDYHPRKEIPGLRYGPEAIEDENGIRDENKIYNLVEAIEALIRLIDKNNSLKDNIIDAKIQTINEINP